MEENLPQDIDQRAELDRIAEKIATLVGEKRASGSTEYFFSQLGNDLGRDKVLLEKITKRKFSEYLTNSLVFDICYSGAHKNILSIKLNHSAEEKLLGKSKAVPRFNKRFWAAFFIPLEAGQRRFINIETCEFGSDRTALNQVAEEIVEVEPEYILNEHQGGDKAVAADNISHWLTVHGLREERFLIQKRRRENIVGVSLLDQLIALLSEDQKRRLSLPFDVVETLLKKR